MPSEARRSLGNGFWNAGQQALSLGLNSLIGVLLVLAVPVAEYGVYSYAVALSSIGIAVMAAGLSGLAVKELVHGRERNAALVTGLSLVRELFAFVGFVLIGAISITSGDQLVIAATLLASTALFGRALNAPELWFLSNLRSARPAIARIVTAVVLFGVRIVLLVFWPNIWVMLALYSLEGFIASLAIIRFYLRDKESPGFARPTLAESFGLLRKSWPLLLSGLADQLNLKASVIVLQSMLGVKAVGIYSAAARLSEVAFFLPVVFMNSTFPVLLKVRAEENGGGPRYRAMLQRSYDQSFWIGVAVAAGLAVFGSLLISLLFGSEYAGAIPVLLIQVLACPFVFMGAVYSKWIIAEGYLWSSLVRHGAGAALNITLNILLIPLMGISGSAVATVASYVVASYLASFFGKKSREAGVQMSLAVVAPVRYLMRWAQSRSSGTQS